MNRMTNILVTAAALAAATLSPAECQPRSTWANIPFAFSARQTKMPAGRYCLMYDDIRDVWKLRTFGHADVEFHGTWTKLAKPAGGDAVLFEHSGDTYRLQAIRETNRYGVAQFTVTDGLQRQQIASADRRTDLVGLLGFRHGNVDRQ